MKDLIIQPTNNTPAVEFLQDGRLRIEGRSLPENSRKFFSPLIEWAGELNARSVNVSIRMEFLNSSSKKLISDLLKVLDASNEIKILNIDWHYEEDDEDILECGQIIEDSLRKAQFRFLEII